MSMSEIQISQLSYRQDGLMLDFLSFKSIRNNHNRIYEIFSCLQSHSLLKYKNIIWRSACVFNAKCVFFGLRQQQLVLKSEDAIQSDIVQLKNHNNNNWEI